MGSEHPNLGRSTADLTNTTYFEDRFKISFRPGESSDRLKRQINRLIREPPNYGSSVDHYWTFGYASFQHLRVNRGFPPFDNGTLNLLHDSAGSRFGLRSRFRSNSGTDLHLDLCIIRSAQFVVDTNKLVEISLSLR